ncbi:hypothetical protein GQ43DRAFT_433631 [Delitschia confertaspora ATCC 74209]|uniref:Uncharacterized protein n=1 Tax=Delitschia confertaspora ATCC 74209 TaxID=1513339 RepID=A0A9P4MQB4_9PLEO|nr:hypothetical protein GQ43DRAFT_433631 [Delitschia confertaspora ATCC 74209]
MCQTSAIKIHLHHRISRRSSSIDLFLLSLFSGGTNGRPAEAKAGLAAAGQTQFGRRKTAVVYLQSHCTIPKHNLKVHHHNTELHGDMCQTSRFSSTPPTSGQVEPRDRQPRLGVDGWKDRTYSIA